MGLEVFVSWDSSELYALDQGVLWAFEAKDAKDGLFDTVAYIYQTSDWFLDGEVAVQSCHLKVGVCYVSGLLCHLHGVAFCSPGNCRNVGRWIVLRIGRKQLDVTIYVLYHLSTRLMTGTDVVFAIVRFDSLYTGALNEMVQGLAFRDGGIWHTTDDEDIL